MKTREQIDEQYKWDLSDYYANITEWENAFNAVKPLYQTLATFEGQLNNKDTILQCFNLQKRVGEIVERLYVYISLKVKEDAKNSFYQNKSNMLQKYLSDVAPTVAYIESEINDLSDEFLNALILDSQFKDYNNMLKDVLKNKPHMLSKQEEKLLAQMGECMGAEQSVFDMLDAVDIRFNDVVDQKGKSHPLNNANYSVYLQSNDPILRKTAFKNLNGAYGKLNYTLCENYMANVKTDCTIAKIRHFNSAFQHSTFGEDVDDSVFLKLSQMVNKHIGVFHKYYKLKQKELKLKTMHNYDVSAKLSSSTKKYTYDQAFEMVIQALSLFGEDYINVLKRAKNERWIDVMPNQNKDTGAFSWGAYGAHPVVLLNFEGTINSVFTLAHELGHMMHTYYSNNNNPSTKSGYEIFVAEVASTVNEMLLAQYLLKNAKTKSEKLFYLDYLMSMFHSTIARQTMFGEFEYAVHNAYENSQDVTCSAINNIYLSFAKKYFGKNVKLADEIQYEWSRIPHFYTSFYVYKYATGLISALALSNKMLKGYKQSVKNYLNFLKSGSTKSPLNLLKDAGVDLNNDESFTSAFDFISNILKEWEAL